ncbi:hypothetical protein HJFPF1_06960 [Paramyrothecium foliicola]|nr:hypothetical protein HJFPF1_06960 [Paramyrothecium foliicola]
MEQQDIIASTSPETPNSYRESSQRPQPPSPSSATQHELSTSEPTLRFPRPQGNRHLANWISSSNPDIMRLASTATDDVGLSESTYELISGTDDSESQDGNYTESMGESVGSLDFHRPDDTHSLAGTEHTQDDESVLDETEPRPEPTTGSAVIVELEDDGQGNTNNEQTDAVDSESDDEARSRCSLEYTQQSLRTPSISTPEASKVLLPKDSDGSLEPSDNIYPTTTQFMKTAAANMIDTLYTRAATALPPLCFGALLILLFQALYPQTTQFALDQQTTLAPTLKSTTIQSLTTSSTSSATRPSVTAVDGVGLIPLEDLTPDNWLFGAKPDIVFKSKAPGEILVFIPSTAKQVWLSKNCLEMVATRSNDRVDMATESVNEGMLVKFPKKETHGLVTLSVKSTCRPKVNKVVKVHFQLGILDEASELTKRLLDLGELVPAAAQEAERCFGNAKRSLEKVSDNLGQNVQTLSGKVADTFGTKLITAQTSFKATKKDVLEKVNKVVDTAARNINEFTGQATQTLPSVAEARDQLQLGLLNAQISAKLWWLKVTSRTEEYGEYQRKARDFLASKLADAEAKYAAAKPASAPRSWAKILGRRKCQRTSNRGRRGIQQCIPEE